MEWGQHFVWERFFFLRQNTWFSSTCFAGCQLMFLEMVLYSGFSMGTRGRMQRCFLLVPETTPKKPWSFISPACSFGRERETVAGRGKELRYERGVSGSCYWNLKNILANTDWMNWSTECFSPWSWPTVVMECVSLESPFVGRLKVRPGKGAPTHAFLLPFLNCSLSTLMIYTGRHAMMARSACFREP